MKKYFLLTLILSVILSASISGLIAYKTGRLTKTVITEKVIVPEEQTNNVPPPVQNQVVTTQVVNEETVVPEMVKRVSPAVVSIIITKDLPKIERFLVNPYGQGNSGFGIPVYRQNGTERREIGGGSGFIISADGYVVTNRHVVEDTTAGYTVLMNDERRFEAKVLARDVVNDLAVLKIEATDLPTVELGDSLSLQSGQTVVAIGNALGEFRNTVSKGVISGLARTVVAGSQNSSEQLTDVIQTDASINPGNSGGPLLNLAGQVVGINTAVVQMAQSIGFAIPINAVKENIMSVQQHGRIIRAWLGVNYVLIDKTAAKQLNLPVDYGAIILKHAQTGLAVIPDSPAFKAGLQENDIILSVNGTRIEMTNPLTKLLSLYKPGETIQVKILRNGSEKEIAVALEEML